MSRPQDRTAGASEVSDQLRRCGFDLEVQARAREYRTRAYRVALFHRLAHLAALLFFILVLGRQVLTWLEPVPSVWLRTALYTLAVLTVPRILSLPVFWPAHRLDRTYGLATTPTRAWLAVATADVLLLGALGSLLFLLPLWPGAFRPGALQVSWFVAALVYVVLLLLQQEWRWRVLLGYKLERAPPEIQERARVLARRAKAQPPRVLVARSPHDARVAAFYFVAFAGLFERIVLSERLTRDLTSEEMDAVLAREIGHRQLWPRKNFAQYILPAFPVAVGADLVLSRVAPAFNLGLGVEALPLFLLLYEGYLLVLSPLTNAISRRFERRADRFALRATGNPTAFARAMVKLHDRNLIYAAPSPFWKHLFGTHPSGVERVERALSVTKVESSNPHRERGSSDGNRT